MITANTSLRLKIVLSNASTLVMLIVLSIACYYSLSKIYATLASVEHTQEVIEQSMEIESAAVDMETGMRGYLLAGKEDFLSPYTSGQKRFSSAVRSLKQEVLEYPKQVQRIVNMEKTIAAWQKDVTEPTIELRRIIGNAETMNDLAARVGKAEGADFFDLFRKKMKLFLDKEQSLLKKRSRVLKKEKDPTKIDRSLDMVNKTHSVILKAHGIQMAAVDMETGVRGFLLAGKEDFLMPYMEGADQFDLLIGELQQNVSDNPSQVTLLKEADSTIIQWREGVVASMIEQRLEIGHAKTMDDMADLVGEARGKKYFDKFRQQISEFRNMSYSLLATRKAAVDRVYQVAEIIIATLAILSLFSAFGFSLFVSKSITKPFQEIFGGLKSFSKNELTGLQTSFNHVVAKLTDSSLQVGDASHQITSSSGDLSSNTGTQAVAVEQTSASIKELSNIVMDNTQLARNSFEISQRAAKNVDDLSHSFDEIEESNGKVENLVKVINEIGNKTKVIDEIVFQTKLLSFNASVEAERAGEHGRGFSVVAQEVGNLAALSGKAAVEISAIVKDSTVKGAIIAQENSERVKKGANAMRKTAEQIKAVSDTSQKIVTASQDQTSSVKQINQAIQEINSATQNSATIAAESSISSDKLSEQAATMKDLVTQLNHYLTGDIETNDQASGSVISIESREAVSEDLEDFDEDVAIARKVS